MPSNDNQTASQSVPVDAPPTMASPLAQDYAKIFHNGDTSRYVEGSGLVQLDDGTLIAVVPVVPRYKHRARRSTESLTHVLQSSDRGRTWNLVSRLPHYSAVPWTHRGILYLFAMNGGVAYRNDDLMLVASHDSGRTWSKPATLFEGHFWNCHTGMAIRDDVLYWAVDDIGLGPGYEKSAVPEGAARAPRAIACDLTKDPMDPKAWRMSNPVAFPEGTAILANAAFSDRPSHYLEPNVINVYGRIRMLATVKLHGQTTSNICAVLDVTDSDGKLSLSLAHIGSMPGGQLKFCVEWDEVSQLFWATVNPPADSQRLFGWEEARPDAPDVFMKKLGGDDRRFLMLYYGVDGLNWFPAGCIAKAEHPSQSYMYPKLIIDGEDIAVISRTSINAPDRHDSDHATFHRIRNFRRLAMDLFPTSP